MCKDDFETSFKDNLLGNANLSETEFLVSVCRAEVDSALADVEKRLAEAVAGESLIPEEVALLELEAEHSIAEAAAGAADTKCQELIQTGADGAGAAEELLNAARAAVDRLGTKRDLQKRLVTLAKKRTDELFPNASHPVFASKVRSMVVAEPFYCAVAG